LRAIAVILDESTLEILLRLASPVDVQAECNPARVAKLRFILQRMKAGGLHVPKAPLEPDLPIESRAPCDLRGIAYELN
jgi:hypothetical protein